MIDAIASLPQYRAHVEPVWDALGRPGSFLTPEPGRSVFRATAGRDRGDAVIVASWRDLLFARRLGYRRVFHVEHGAGQSYAGERRSARISGYPGGKGYDDVAAFIVPNEQAADRWRRAYPGATVAVVGRVADPLPDPDGEPGTVAMSFHWPCLISPEAGNAWRDFRAALVPMRQAFPDLIGHAHPRAAASYRRWFEACGIPFVERFEDVARAATVYVADNSSTLFEWAATGRPVVLMNAKRWRRGVHHGLRFWSESSVGLQVDRPEDLIGQVRMAMRDPKGVRVERARVSQVVYPDAGGALAAAEVIRGM